MELLIVSFMAGVLTVLAPCILPLLPVIVGGSVIDDNKGSLARPLIITASLVVSVIIFTLLLKATTALLGIPVMVWSVIAGGIVVLLGLNLLFPTLWEKMMLATGLQLKTTRLLDATQQQKAGVAKDVVLGAALGPVFNSCSPTYALIVAVVLPASFAAGLANIVAYALGLGAILLLIALLGRTITQKLRWASNPGGWFKKTIGVVFIVVGLLVMFGIDKKVQAFVLENGWYDPVMKIEQTLRR